MVINEVPFLVEEEEESLEPLRMEHFYLPLILFMGSLILSTTFFIVEIIIKIEREMMTHKL